jgi:RNA polymerase subunit RPABC4/transcription elongation factor Spt4
VDQDTLNSLLLIVIPLSGAIASAVWLGLILWTWRDVRQRSRDPLAQIAAALLVALLGVFGVVIYIMLRPPETLSEAYERSLEEEALLQNIEEKPVCPGCGRPVKDNWQVCPFCHTKLKKACISCGELLDLPWNICPYCATPQVSYEAQPARAGRPQRRANRPAPAAPPPNSAPDAPDAAPAEGAVEFVEDDGY